MLMSAIISITVKGVNGSKGGIGLPGRQGEVGSPGLQVRTSHMSLVEVESTCYVFRALPGLLELPE